ncbi:hypothetical protein JST97_02435 [bacterium]|nr:hypothetical protein [bacterium]
MKKTVICLLGMWILSAVLAGPLKADYLKMNPTRPMVRYQDVLLDLLGEGRTMLARYLWFKMDTMHEQIDDQGVATFKQKEVVPLLRMINYLDPYLTDAYDTLASELYYGYQRIDQANELIDEGLMYTPGSYELNFRKAFLADHVSDSVTAFEFARRAPAADQDPSHNLAALGIMYRAALRSQDARTGVQVVDLLTRLGGSSPAYQEQYLRWKEELRK